jgi:hypothetical protein
VVSQPLAALAIIATFHNDHLTKRCWPGAAPLGRVRSADWFAGDRQIAQRWGRRWAIETVVVGGRPSTR